MCKFPAVILEFAEKVNTAFTVRITIKDNEENLFKKEEYTVVFAITICYFQRY